MQTSKLTFLLGLVWSLSACSVVDSEPESADPVDPVEVTSGKLPPEVIQRVVRSRFDDFRGCQRRAAGDPSGTVRVRFVIEEDGSVRDVEDAGSDLADPSVVACVERAFEAMKFPAPTGGTIEVVYPVLLGRG
ncbi:MAG: AgmX/PglI C-terminal domain-containing protein [Polyangiaceae bacterium]